MSKWQKIINLRANNFAFSFNMTKWNHWAISKQQCLCWQLLHKYYIREISHIVQFQGGANSPEVWGRSNKKYTAKPSFQTYNFTTPNVMLKLACANIVYSLPNHLHIKVAHRHWASAISSTGLGIHLIRANHYYYTLLSFATMHHVNYAMLLYSAICAIC